MGFFKKLIARLNPPKHLQAEQQVHSIQRVSRNAPAQTETLSDARVRSQSARKVNELKSQSPIRISADEKEEMSHQNTSRKAALSECSQFQSVRVKEVQGMADSPPPPVPPLPFDIPLPLRPPPQPDFHRVSSLDHLARDYSSRTPSPEPDSIFGPHVMKSTDPSPASTISDGSLGHKHFKKADAPALATINLALIPEELDVKGVSAAFPVQHGENRTKSRLSVHTIRTMRAKMYAGSDSSSHDSSDEANPSSVPEQTFASSPGVEGSKRFSNLVSNGTNSATESFCESTKEPQKNDTPPSLPETSPMRSTPIGAALNTIAPAPKTEAPQTSTLQPPVHSEKWHGKQPLTRTDSFTMLPSRPKPLYTSAHPAHHWTTTHARFMSIFDAIPSNVGGARRENPKLYNMRKRRALVQLGLMEWEMVEAPQTPRGVQIMALLDVLEERMEGERREKARRTSEDEAKGRARKVRCVRDGSVSAHCANDARSGFGQGYVPPGKMGKRERREKSSKKGKSVDTRGQSSKKGKAV